MNVIYNYFHPDSLLHTTKSDRNNLIEEIKSIPQVIIGNKQEEIKTEQSTEEKIHTIKPLVLTISEIKQEEILGESNTVVENNTVVYNNIGVENSVGVESNIIVDDKIKDCCECKQLLNSIQKTNKILKYMISSIMVGLLYIKIYHKK